MQANWFIGLRVLGGSFVAQLSPPPQVRLFSSDDLHITLAFLGKVSEQRARDSFANVTALQLAPLTTSLGEVAALGSRRRPSAFSALPCEHREEIERAMSALRDVLCDVAGVARETRPALAHVTFARPARRATAQEVAHAVAWARSLDLGRPRVRIESAALYTWSSDRARSLFQIVAEHVLTNATREEPGAERDV